MEIITLAGIVGKSEIKKTQNGEFLAFSVACGRKDKDGNKSTNWYSCVYSYTRIAEYVSKGTRVTVVGTLTIGQYKAQDGSARIDLKVNVQSLDFYNTQRDTDTPDTAPAATAPAPAPETVDSVPF